MLAPIMRTLAYDGPECERTTLEQDKIGEFDCPVVILGDPGLGKTVLTKALSKQPGAKYISADKLTRTPKPDSLISAGQRVIIIDGLDEIASAAPGSAIEKVLEKLSAMNYPKFVLSCREADWLTVDRVKIKDDYGVVPRLLHLQPFTRDNAYSFLSLDFPKIDAEVLLNHLEHCGIEALYGNPLTLRMLGEVAQNSDPLPNTRAQLFDSACGVMLKEENQYHHEDPHVMTNKEELLLATGAICAMQLLCDCAGVYTGPYSDVPDGFLHISDIKELPRSKAANDVLKTRLFQSQSECKFSHIHRVIAEFLGAKWLARCFDDGLSQKRIFNLFRQNEGVPTSLRGLNAWMAHFSSALAGRCIDADPYAVLLYGDTERLELSQARTLFFGLKKLFEQDSYFKLEGWGRHSASGLMRSELREEILSEIAPKCSTQFNELLLEAMAGTKLAKEKELVQTLKNIMLDQTRTFHSRLYAWKALHTNIDQKKQEEIVNSLLNLNDSDSAQLAGDILADIKASTLSLRIIIDIIINYAKFVDNPNATSASYKPQHLLNSVFQNFNTNQLPTLLDGIAKHAKPLFDDNKYSSKRQFIVDILSYLMAQILTADSTIKPSRIWSWIVWRNGDLDYCSDMVKMLASIFCDNKALRQALQKHICLTSCADNFVKKVCRLPSTGLDLFPNSKDIADLLPTLRTRVDNGAIDPDMWRNLLQFGQTENGLAPVVYKAAIEVANGNEKLVTILDELINIPVSEPEWKTMQKEQKVERKAKRDQVFQQHCNNLAAQVSDIDTVDIYTLSKPAFVYLDHACLNGHELFDPNTSPESRMHDFLGEELGERVMLGFISVLERDDLPSSSKIAELYCDNKSDNATIPMICGVAEMLRRNHSLDAVNRDTLFATYMALALQQFTFSTMGNNISEEIERVLFQKESDWETHFCTSIEPQLECGSEHINELYRLTNNSHLTNLARRLAVDWLSRYQAMPLSNQETLLICALRSDETQLKIVRNLVSDRIMVNSPLATSAVDPRLSGCGVVRERLLWLSAGYDIDFDKYRTLLKKAAEDHQDFLWFIRDRVSPERRDAHFNRFSVNQLAFIVENFGTTWSLTNQSNSVTVTPDNLNPWDATEFIQDAIDAIAGHPQSEATEALQRLIDNHAPSYINCLKHALALQHRVQRDHDYVPPKIKELQAVMKDDLPETIDDMRSYFADRLEELQERIQGSNTDIWEVYWKDKDEPQDENFCRNRMIECILQQLPESIRFEPEMHMPNQKRVDIAAICNNIGLPAEIKGQWHPNVWNAANDQLENYTRDWRAEGRGVYIVLWFGENVLPQKKLKRHPDDIEQPKTPGRLQELLIDRLPEARRTDIDVFVIDVSNPANPTNPQSP